MLEKLLLASLQPNTSQRHVIFKTKCTINDKVCEVLIDSNSAKNVITRKVVKALNLPMVKHSKPYKISWVKRSLDISISETCNVTFFIGKNFINNIVCDVVSMDVCHLILGRP